MEWESIEEVLGATVARMRKRWPAVRFQLRVSPALPPVKAEAALLAQVVANLVDNGVRHSAEPAQIEIAAGRSREGVFVAVRDHGEGLSEGDAASIFERYRPGAHGGGAGLGLAICKLIVQAHGGSIEAHRREPGTEFRIDLPVADVEVAT
jgi:two-component system, OmpR family, sensor histidine kinase KdpD